MHPIILRLGPITIYSYGLMLAIGILVSLAFIRHRAPKEEYDPNKITDLAIWLVLMGVIGSRIFYIIENYELFTKNFLDVFKIWQGGLIYYGALIFATIYLLIYAKINKLGFLKLADFCIPYIPLAHGFGRIGCFLNGCCWGKKTDLPWAVKFPSLSYSVHPVQIYSSIFCFFVFILLYFIHKRKRFDGGTILSYFLIYPFGRFFIDFFRYNEQTYIFDLSMAQLMSVFSVLAASLIYSIFFIKYRGEIRRNV